MEVHHSILLAKVMQDAPDAEQSSAGLVWIPLKAVTQDTEGTFDSAIRGCLQRVTQTFNKAPQPNESEQDREIELASVIQKKPLAEHVQVA